MSHLLLPIMSHRPQEHPAAEPSYREPAAEPLPITVLPPEPRRWCPACGRPDFRVELTPAGCPGCRAKFLRARVFPVTILISLGGIGTVSSLYVLYERLSKGQLFGFPWLLMLAAASAACILVAFLLLE